MWNYMYCPRPYILQIAYRFCQSCSGWRALLQLHNFGFRIHIIISWQIQIFILQWTSPLVGQLGPNVIVRIQEPFQFRFKLAILILQQDDTPVGFLEFHAKELIFILKPDITSNNVLIIAASTLNLFFGKRNSALRVVVAILRSSNKFFNFQFVVFRLCNMVLQSSYVLLDLIPILL